MYRKTLGSSGFTIVELLIVVVVIAILAAITVVAYTGVTSRAHDAAIRSDLRNMASQFEQYYATEGVYPTSVSVLAGTPPIKVTKTAYSLSGTNGRNLGICVVSGAGLAQRFVFAALSKSGDAIAYSSSSGLYEPTSFPTTGAQVCSLVGISTSETGSWSTWGAENGAPNGWYSWVK